MEKSNFGKLGIKIHEKDIEDTNLNVSNIRVLYKGIDRTEIRTFGTLTTDDLYYAYSVKKNELADEYGVDSVIYQNAINELNSALSELVIDLDAAKEEVVSNYRQSQPIETTQKSDLDTAKEEVVSKYRQSNKQHIKATQKSDLDAAKEEKHEDEIKVENVDGSKEAQEVAKKGKFWVAIATAATIAAIATTAYSCGKRNANISYVEPAIETTIDNTDETKTEEVVEETTPVEKVVVEETAPVEEVVETTPVEQAIEETTPVEDTSIETVIDNVYTNLIEVQQKDPSFAQGFDKDGITALVLYARNDENNILSNENAYSYMSDLVLNKEFNISEIYKGTESYESMKKIETAFDNVNEGNAMFDDESSVYFELNDAVQNMSEDNYPLAIGISAMRNKANGFGVDNSSMSAARGLGQNNPSAEQIMNQNYFNNIDINNQNSKLTQIVYKALDADKQFTLSK